MALLFGTSHQKEYKKTMRSRYVSDQLSLKTTRITNERDKGEVALR